MVRSLSKRHSVKVAVNAALLSANVDQAAVTDKKTFSLHAPVFNTRGIKKNGVFLSVDVTENIIIASRNGINDDSNLCNRAQATLVAEIPNVFVRDDICRYHVEYGCLRL
jgi:hypothetical protein